jgi:hypothetical protein
VKGMTIFCVYKHRSWQKTYEIAMERILQWFLKCLLAPNRKEIIRQTAEQYYTKLMKYSKFVFVVSHSYFICDSLIALEQFC